MRWIGPAGVEREGMEVESVWPRIISLVLNVVNYNNERDRTESGALRHAATESLP